MNTLSSTAILAGRVLLALIFIMAGVSKLGDISGTMAYTASGGLPGVFALPAIALEVLGGLAILVGWQTRITALLFAAFCLVAGVLYHYLPAQGAEGMAQMMQMTMFYKNIGLAGGFLILAGAGAGAYALDARQGSRTALA